MRYRIRIGETGGSLVLYIGESRKTQTVLAPIAQDLNILFALRNINLVATIIEEPENGED